MPKVTKTINDVYSTVTRPVAFSALRRIAQLCNWDFENEEVIFRGHAPQPMILAGLDQVPNTAFTEIKGNADAYLRIELQEMPEDNATVTDTVFKRNALPIFLDPKLGISLTPAYTTMNGTLSITKRFPDLPSAERWWYDIKRLITQDHNAAFLAADYSYIIPWQFLMVLKEIHVRREAIAGYGDKFSEYLRNCFDERATTETTVQGVGESKTVRLVVREHQEEINGWFDFGGDVPKPEKVDNSGSYDVSFSYKYQYEAPTEIVARYPVQIHQQMLPEKYLNKPTYSVRDERRTRRGGMAVQYQDRLRGQFLPKINRHNNAYRYPELDEWLPSLRSDVELPATTVFTGLFSINPDQPNLLVEFHELAECAGLHQEFQEWVREYPQWMKTYYQSPFYFEVWKNDVVYNNTTWRMDEHGNFVSDHPLDLRSTYRVRLALLNDLSRVQPECLKAMCEYPLLVTEILLALGAKSKDVPKPNNRGVIDFPELLAAIRKLPATAQWFRQGGNILVPQVLIGTIIGVNKYGASTTP